MSAVFPASIILVSNSLALFGSLGPFPLVTVCGKVSLLVTVTLSPFFTVIVSGSKFGLPCTEAPASIVSGFPGGPAVALVVPAGAGVVAAGPLGAALFACTCVSPGGIPILVRVPVSFSGGSFGFSFEAAGALWIIVFQNGIKIAAPKASTITIMRMPLAILLGLVLVMGLSSCVVIIFFTNLEWISHTFFVQFLSSSCRFYQINQHDDK